MYPHDTTEEWRPVIGYEGWYSVSSLGRVRRERAYRTTTAGRILKSRWLHRYLYVVLSCAGHRAVKPVHQLVAQAFLGPCPTGLEINHRNGLRADNRVANLEYCTHRENMEHAGQYGLVAAGDHHWSRRHPEWVARGNAAAARRHPESLPRGELHHHSRLTAELVIELRTLYAAHIPPPVLAQRFGITLRYVFKIVKRQAWAHISDPPNGAGNHQEKM